MSERERERETERERERERRVIKKKGFIMENAINEIPPITDT